jgi:hypothetical protein
LHPNLTKQVVDFIRAAPPLRAACLDDLYTFSSGIFENDTRDGFEAMLTADGLLDARILFFRDGGGRVRGYNLVRRFQPAVDGRPVDLFRAVAAMAPEYRGGGSTLGFGMALAIKRKLRHPARPCYYIGALVHPSSYYLFAKNTAEIWPRHDRVAPPETRALIAQLARATGIDIADPAHPFVTFDGVPTRQDADEATFWRDHPRPEVQLFLKLNPRYGEGYGLVTLVPLTWKNLAVGAFRAATAGLRRRRK